MNAERLLSHYHEIADAPDAIARLRRFILDLAVRGKLLPQDAADEPASDLLKRITAEKARLVKAGEIRRNDLPVEVDLDEFPLVPPNGWILSRLATISRRIHYGYTASADTALKDVRMLRITDIHENAVDWQSVPGCLIDPKSIGQYRLAKGDILIARTGGTIGKTFLVGEVPVLAVFASYLIRVQGMSNVLDQFLKLFLESPLYWTQLYDGARGTGQPNVNGQTLGRLILPLPPLAEQHRIVAKVDELMGLCDRLEAARASREAVRDRLAAASLARLNSPNPETFAADARFTVAALTALTTRPDQVKQLRQAILNLAVRGKLVPQDPKDEPASVRPADCDERPDVIPLTWLYTRLDNLLAEDTRNGYSRKPDEALNGTPILRISAGTVRRDGIVAEEEHKLISGIDEQARFQYGLTSGDLLACRFNGNKAFVGRLTIFKDYLGIQPIYPDKLIRVRVARKLAAPEFLRLASDTDLVRSEVELVCATTVGNWGISASNLKGVRFPLPPPTEQHRIVAKVDALMALCDQLEASLAAATTTRRRLLDALLAEALSPAEDRELEAAE
ncbi:restriction endonuclease subunit S [Mesorhizobium sp. ORM8.1]